MAEGYENPGNPSPIFFLLFHPQAEDSEKTPGLPAQQRVHFKKLKMGRRQGMESGPEKGGAKFGTAPGRTSTPEAIPVLSQLLGREAPEACTRRRRNPFYPL